MNTLTRINHIARRVIGTQLITGLRSGGDTKEDLTTSVV